MARRRSWRRERRRQQERAFETAIYGMIFVLFAIAILYPTIDANVVALAGGTILVGSAVYQTQRRWRTNFFTWIGGLFLLGIGLLSIAGSPIPLGELLPLVVLVAVVGLSIVTGEL